VIAFKLKDKIMKNENIFLAIVITIGILVAIGLTANYYLQFVDINKPLNSKAINDVSTVSYDDLCDFESLGKRYAWLKDKNRKGYVLTSSEISEMRTIRDKIDKFAAMPGNGEYQSIWLLEVR
jgi:hypothetical protein